MHLDRLDKAALLFIAVLLAVIAVVLLRGDQVGVQITRTAPSADAAGVATRAQISFSFSEPMQPASVEGLLRTTPALTGTWHWNGSTAYFVPQVALQRDTTYTVTVQAGGQSTRGRAMLRDTSWSFHTGHPRVIYLSPATGVGDLFVREISSAATPQRITSEPFGVFDFAVSPDGLHIVYSATRDDGGARDLWLINADGSGRERLATCDDQVCQTPTWSPDSTRIAFERRNLVSGAVGRSPGPSRIWLYDLQSKSVAPLLADSQQLGTLPRWAPIGDKLSYYDPLASAVSVIDVVTGERIQLTSVLGDSGAWSPDATQIIYPELAAMDTGSFNQLLRADLPSSIITPVMALSSTNDSSPAWSPTGDLIAFTRQYKSSAAATGGYTPFGPQIWISTPDGRNMKALTNQPEFSYGGLAWSPDGESIVAVRNNLQQPNPRPEVWLVQREGSEQQLLAENATIPEWLP